MIATLTRAEIVEHANDIAVEYQNDGLTLTLRQMYYQFVSRGLTGNGQEVYDRIGATLTEARYDGTFPISGLEDRGRSVDKGAYTVDNTDAADALHRIANELRRGPHDWIWRSRWLNQPTHISVWVEKEALSGIFAPACERLGVSFNACKGYPSVSLLWSWMAELADSHAVNNHDRALILYFGDHDPDGFQIPRSALASIGKLSRLDEAPEIPRVDLRRVALNRDQVDTYNPPPFPAKVSSARFKGYVEEHETLHAWELDALEPRVLRDLIASEVRAHFDGEIHAENTAKVADVRAEVKDAMQSPRWIRDVLGGDEGGEE